VKEQEAKAVNTHQVVLYVERADASYGPLQTGSYLAQEFIDDFFLKREHYRLECLRKLEAGEVSAVWFYLQTLGLAEADLAARVGVSRRAVRRHLTPSGFGEIDLRLAARYAEVFGVPVANLFQTIAARDERVELRQERTANPLLTRTRVGVAAPAGGAGDADAGDAGAGQAGAGR
jgi:DNA-binding XRE family transcriptional regulator